MHVTLTWESIVSVGAVISALLLGWSVLSNSVNWLNTPKKNKRKLEELHDLHERDMHDLKEELRILTKGTLACLKGLQEKGCNGPVTKGIAEIEEHINKKAHE